LNAFLANQNIKVWFNNKGYDASVSHTNIINNALLRSHLQSLNSSIDITRHGIVLFNHPMPFTQGEFIAQLQQSVLIDLFVAICMVFALSFIPASFLVFLLEERQNNSKQLQFVSGVKPYIYWISNFTWDLINYIVPCLLCIIIFLLFNVKAYICAENFPCLVALILLYGWACIPLMYPLNYLFKVPSTAFVVSSSLNVFIGVVSTMTVTVLDQLGETETDLMQINAILKPVFTVFFPHFCLGQGFLQMSLLYNTAAAQRAFGYTVEFTPFGFDDVGRNLVALAIQGCVYFTFNLLVQYKFFVRVRPTKNVDKLNLPGPSGIEDDDVVVERKRVLANEAYAKLNKRSKFKNPFKKRAVNELNNDNNAADEDYIRLVNLTKVYKKFDKLRFRKNTAVNNLCLGINKGECFGLIGVNGAGKTTTFKMVTGEIPMSGGEVYVGGQRVSKNLEKVHKNIGYCPQSDAIFPLLTAREHLIYFARLRGIPERYVNRVCEWALHRVGLQVFADRISGGIYNLLVNNYYIYQEFF
jgi:ATP-binding cassette subfamily A (ABC1) protein 1